VEGEFSEVRNPKQLASNSKDTRFGGYARPPTALILNALASEASHSRRANRYFARLPTAKVRREVVFKKDQAPQPVDLTFTLGPEYCGFPVLFEVSGKTKATELPNGDRLYQNPTLRVTLTNKETGKQETHGSTGTIRATDLEGGDVSLVSTGQNVIFSPSIGILVLNGRYTFVEDEDENFTQPQGNGRIIKACDQLA
jgi:hypothetical protein